jgi:hypothetical protein
MKSLGFKKIWFYLNEIISYVASGLLGFIIGVGIGGGIFLGFGFQKPNRNPPLWFHIIEWPIIILPIVFCIIGRYLIKKISRGQNRKHEPNPTSFNTNE